MYKEREKECEGVKGKARRGGQGSYRQKKKLYFSFILIRNTSVDGIVELIKFVMLLLFYVVRKLGGGK